MTGASTLTTRLFDLASLVRQRRVRVREGIGSACSIGSTKRHFPSFLPICTVSQLVNLYSERKNSSGNVRAWTRGHIFSTIPSAPMRMAARFAFGPSPAPRAAVLFSVSQSNGKSKLYLAANAAFPSVLSKLAPSTCTLCSASCGRRSLKASASAVQPGVSHLGYHHISTRFPVET